jgi:hypothetical protein
MRKLLLLSTLIIRGENKPVTGRRSKKFATYLLKDFDFSNGFGAEVE